MSGPTCWEDQLLRLWGYLVIIFLVVSYVHFLFSPVEILFSSNVSALLSLLLRIFAFPAQKANITIRVTGPSFPSTDNKRIPCLRLCGSHLFSFLVSFGRSFAATLACGFTLHHLGLQFPVLS